ncbi:MAG: hypothetical protein H7282_04240 [Cytophagaceae bacterium]|nr:hypothetical protein [Cytophagaceae bacterium]
MENLFDIFDRLFEQYKTSSTAEEKDELAILYQDSLNEMHYDFSCGKLTDDGVDLMMPIVEKIEFLNGCISWELRAQTYSILMDQAKDAGDHLAVTSNGQLAIDSLIHQLETEQEQRNQSYHGLANVHYTLVSYVLEDQIEHWKKSLQYIKAAILEEPQTANWTHYLELVFGRLQQETQALSACRNEEKKVFRNWCQTLEEKKGSLTFKIASQFARLKEFKNDSTQDEFLFPENEYLFWLEKSLQDDLPDLSGYEISDIGHFYKKEGMHLQRVDVLQQALRCYRKMIKEEDSGNGFAVYYVTDVLEQIAEVYWRSGDHATADEYMTEALLWNEDKLDHIGSNFSLQLHYAEFLERCESYEGSIIKPRLSFVLEMTKRAEELGEGYYSGPCYIQARLALKENQEHKAAALIAFSLLLHELTIEESLQAFQQHLPKGPFPYLQNFLADTLTFMQEVRANYYFSPKHTFATLRVLTEDEIMGAWILRKAEIKNRNKT